MLTKVKNSNRGSEKGGGQGAKGLLGIERLKVDGLLWGGIGGSE